MKRKLLFLSVILCLLIFSLGCKISPKIGNITGIATIDGVPTSNITVLISGTNESTTTDANGGYSFTGIAFGSVVLTFTKTSYSTQSTTVVVTGGTTAIASAVNLSSSYGNVTGTARLYGQSDHSGITVKIVESGIEAVTDSSGSYQFSNVSSGTVTITFSKNGYSTATASAVIVQSGVTTTVSVMTLQASSTSTQGITGVIDIVGESDDSGVLVSIDGTSLSATTSSDGSFTISSMSAGTYGLTISKTGCITSTTSNITVTSNQTTEIDTISIYKQADVVSSYNMFSVLSGTIQAVEEVNGYIYIATDTYLYRISTQNPTSIINSTVVTHNYLYLASNTWDNGVELLALANSYYAGEYSEDLSTVNISYSEMEAELFDILYNLYDFIYPSQYFFIGFNSTSKSFDQYILSGDGDESFLILSSSFPTTLTNIKGLDSYGSFANAYFYACDPVNIYKLNYNASQYDLVRISNSTNLIGIGHSYPYIWVLDKDSKILYKITDNLL